MSEKGVIVEYDFTVLNGAEVLYETMRRFLENLDGIPFDSTLEAKHFAGGNYQGCFAEYFPIVKTKKTALKAGKDFDVAFRKALDAAIPAAPMAAGFRNFIKALTEKGVKVVIATRADLEAVSDFFAPVLGDRVVLYHEESVCYGSVKWDSWRRTCAALGLRYYAAAAVTGSGYGVKSALRAGLPSMAVANPRVAYQDFSGCDELVTTLDTAAAKKLLDILRI